MHNMARTIAPQAFACSLTTHTSFLFGVAHGLVLSLENRLSDLNPLRNTRGQAAPIAAV